MDQRSKAVLLGLGRLQDGFEGISVAHFHASSGGVDHQFLSQRFRDRIRFFQQLRPELDEIGEGWLRRGIAAIDGRADAVVDLSSLGPLSLAERTVGGAVASDGVELFESETGRVDAGMTTGTALGFAVFGKLLADGGRPTNVRLDRRNARRGWWCGLSEEFVEDPDSAKNG